MSKRDTTSEDIVLAEAAAWLVRLQEEGRTPAAEAAFRAWLSEPAHADAFARVTDTWDIIPGGAHKAGLSGPSVRKVRGPVLAATCLALVVFAGLLAILHFGQPSYRTAVGEQQTIALDDGSRIVLNTATEVVVDYSAAERRVRLRNGEALFEVAKDSRRPFVVEAGDEEIRALGTTFLVRLEDGGTAVTLVEGRVQVGQREAGLLAVRKPAAPVAVLTPGERVVLKADVQAKLDRPSIDAALAWRRGEIMFDDATLAEAAAEISRYDDLQVVVDPRLAGLRISGVFPTGHADEFAQLTAELHGLRTYQDGQRIVLAR